MPRPFARVHACSTNDHGADNDKIKGWVEHAGGTYTTCIMPNTTHLLCSKSAWKRYSPLVKEARRSKKIKIVKLDWLIMSLTKHSNKAKNKPLPTTQWEWDQRKLIKSEQERKRSGNGEGNNSQDTSSSPQLQRVMELEKMGRTFTHALQRLETKMSEAGYTLFTDALGFQYSLALLRKDTHSTLAQYSLYVSDETKPRFGLASITVDGRGCAVTQDIVPMGNGKGLALEMWRRVFLGRTGKMWEEGRLKGVLREGEWVWNGRDVVWQLDGAGDAADEADADDAKASGTTTPSAFPTKHRHTSPPQQPTNATHPDPAGMTAKPPARSPAAPTSTSKPPAQTPAKGASRCTLAGKIRKTGKSSTSSSAAFKADDMAKGVSVAKAQAKTPRGVNLARYFEGLQ